jgi:hypothetical protein
MTDPSAFQPLADTILPTRRQEPPNLGLADCWRTPVAALITTGPAAVISEDERAQRHPPAAGLLGRLGSADPRLAVAVANSVAIRQSSRIEFRFSPSTCAQCRRATGMETAQLDRPSPTTPTQRTHPRPPGPNTNSAKDDDQPWPPEGGVDLLRSSRHSPGSRTRLDGAAN